MAHPGTDSAVAILIVVSTVLLFFELTHRQYGMVHRAGEAITWIFIVELSLRCWVARSTRQFFREYWLDVISVLPFFRAWRVMRVFRLVRLFRVGTLVVRSNRRLAILLRQTIGEQLNIFMLILVTILGVSLGLLNIESETPGFQSFGETFWWSLFSIVAGEPVGSMPQTIVGRLLTLVIMLAGLTIFALFTGTFSAVMAERVRQGLRANLMNIEDLTQHTIICGWNRSAKILIDEMRMDPETQSTAIVVVAEKRPEGFDNLADDPHLFFLEGDYTRVDLLNRAGVKVAARAVLLADRSVATRSDQDRDARTILAGLLIEKLHPGIFACAELLSRDNEPHLVMAGIEEIVVGDEYSAHLLATSARVRGVTDIAGEIFSHSHGNQIYKRNVRAEWVDKSFLEVQTMLKREMDVLAVAVERAGGPGDSPNQPGQSSARRRTLTNPPADYRFAAGDRLIVFAQREPVW